MAEGVADGPAEVEGRVKDVVGETGETLSGDVTAGEGTDREVDRGTGERNSELSNHFYTRKDLAHRDGVQPKAATLRPPKGKAAKAFGEVAGVGPVPQNPVDQIH